MIGECEKAITWSESMVADWLRTGMLADDPDPAAKAAQVVKELSDHALTLSHARHLSAEKCASIGLKVSLLEDSQEFQEAVLSVHHSCLQNSRSDLCGQADQESQRRRIDSERSASHEVVAIDLTPNLTP